jgi:5'-AMP-activated protein kinase catalytic alpha subunit
MIAGNKYIGLQVDIWSAGVVLFALLCGYLPFEDPNTANLYKKILNGEYTLPKLLSHEAKEMLKGILNTDPAKRFTIEDIRKHRWFTQVPSKPRQGIVVGVHQIPVEALVLAQLEKYGFNPDYTQKCVEANKHNAATTTYYLLLQKFVREGGKSAADMASDMFEPMTIGKRLYTLRETPNLPLDHLDVDSVNLPKHKLGSLVADGKSQEVVSLKTRKVLDLSASRSVLPLFS